MYPRRRSQSQVEAAPAPALQTSTPAMDLRENIDVTNPVGIGETARSDQKKYFRTKLLKYKYFIMAIVIAFVNIILFDGRSCSYSWLYNSSCIAVDSDINVHHRNSTFNNSQLKTTASNCYSQTNIYGQMGQKGTIYHEELLYGKKKQSPSWLDALSLKPFVQYRSNVMRHWLSPGVPESSPTKLVDLNDVRESLIAMLLVPPLLLLLQPGVPTGMWLTTIAGILVFMIAGVSLTVEQMALWVQSDRLMLLAAALSWNAAVCDTGLYDVLALYVAKKCKSSVVVICALWASAAIGAYADYVVCTALLTPLIIRLMEEYEVEPTPVVAAASVLADLSAHLCARAGTMGRALHDELGETQEPVVWGVLTFCTAAAYFAVAFVLFKPHLYNEDHFIVELQHEIRLWQRLKLAMLQGAEARFFFGYVVDWQIYGLRQDIRRLEQDPDCITPSHHLPQRSVKVHKPKLLLFSCTVVGVVLAYMYLRAVDPEENSIMDRTVIWTMLSLLLLAGPQLSLNSLVFRIDLTTLLMYAATNFYGNVLVMLRFPEIVARFVILPYMIKSPTKVISVGCSVVFWISAILSAGTGSGAARPLAVTLRVLRDHLRPIAHAVPLLMPSVASAATLGHAIGSLAFVASSPSAVAAATASEQQGYKLSAVAYACLMLPLIGILLTAHCCHFKYNL